MFVVVVVVVVVVVFQGHCYQCAVQNGVAHAQLPISQFIKLNSRKVLAVNHGMKVVSTSVSHVRKTMYLMHLNSDLTFYKNTMHCNEKLNAEFAAAIGKARAWNIYQFRVYPCIQCTCISASDLATVHFYWM